MAKGIKTGGRKSGTPNKVNQEFRDTIKQLLDDNADNVALWLRQVATGEHGKEPAPEKALDLLAKLAEYAAPKLSRMEHAGDASKPIVHRIERTIIDGNA